MLLILLDHIREIFFLHHQIGDLMDVASTEPALFLSRALAHLYTPVFVFLTGLSAFLYDEEHQGRRAASVFPFKRGLFLVALKLILVNFAWTFQPPPTVIYLQVIWVIGLSMLTLAASLRLPHSLLTALGVLLVAGHNPLDSLHFAPGSAWHLPWTVLHDRDWIEAGDALCLRAFYPLLSWIGMIALDYAVGNQFNDAMPAAIRRRCLLAGGDGLLLSLILLRSPNGYDERLWAFGETSVITLMGFFNVTKYPPSPLSLAPTLGIGLLLLAWFERLNQNSRGKALVTFGKAPMSFYLLYLYLLKLPYLLALATWGANRDDYFGLSPVPALWLYSILLIMALYPAVHQFAGFKARWRDTAWLKYF